MDELLVFWDRYIEELLSKAKLLGMTKEQFRQQLIKGQSTVSFGEFMEWCRKQAEKTDI